MASILIVDDDPTLRAIATELLRGAGHVIIEAEDGDEALKVIGAVPVDLVVLDMLMPNKDGLEVIRELRRAKAQVRILAISSGGRAGVMSYLETAKVFGADEALAKPLTLATFAATVDRLLGATGAAPDPWLAVAS